MIGMIFEREGSKFMLEQFVKQLVDGMPPNTPGLTIEYEVKSLRLLSTNAVERNRYELSVPPINKLPYANPKSFDLLFKLLRVDEVIAIYTALMIEDKRILVLC